jgi:ribonucleotide monophosphatase NagD (HAD superfamily)
MSNYLQQNPDILFYVTNKDRIFSAGKDKGMNGDTRFMVDIGAQLAMCEKAANREAIVVGKPDTLAFKIILQDHFANTKIDLTKFIMIGDNPQSDI